LVWEARTPTGWAWNGFGLAMGLGFVLSFGYWCTDFLVVQARHGGGFHERRATHAADRGFPKMFFPCWSFCLG